MRELTNSQWDAYITAGPKDRRVATTICPKCRGRKYLVRVVGGHVKYTDCPTCAGFGEIETKDG